MSNGFLSIVAAGTALADATGIPSHCNLIKIGTCTSSAYGVSLPAELGDVVKIRNDGAYTASIFPYNAASAINGLAAGAALLLAPNASVSISAVSDTPVHTVVSGRITAYGSPVVQYYAFGYCGPEPVKSLTATYTVPQGESGITYSIASAAAAVVLTLPAPTIPGLKYKFLVGGSLSNTVTITSTSTNIKGIIHTPLHSTVAYSATGSTSVVFATSAIAGDCVEIQSDGTIYHLLAYTSKNAQSITLA